MAALKAIVYQAGEIAIDYSPSGDLAAGDVVDLGNCIGYTTHPVAANATGALMLDGVIDGLKYTGEVIALWAPVYWDVGTGTFTGTIAYSEATAGKCVRAAAGGDATVRILVLPTAS